MAKAGLRKCQTLSADTGKIYVHEVLQSTAVRMAIRIVDGIEGVTDSSLADSFERNAADPVKNVDVIPTTVFNHLFQYAADLSRCKYALIIF